MAGKILVADDVATNRIILKVKLSTAHYDVILAETAAEVLALAKDTQPDLIVLDERLGSARGIDLVRRLKSQDATRAIPVIMVTAQLDPEQKLAALNAGADEFLCKPLDELTLMARVRSLLRARETSKALLERGITVAEMGFSEAAPGFAAPGRIALVAHDPNRALLWADLLHGLVRDTVTPMSMDQALSNADTDSPADIFVIESDLADPGEGLRLLSELRSRPGTRYAAILIVHDRDDSRSAVTALDLGANDLLTAGFEPAELALRLRSQLRRKQEGDQLRANVDEGLRLALIDPLTGLYNRRYAMTHLGRVAAKAQESGRSYAVMLADIDRFKQVNDAFGHAAGDAVLSEIARRLKDNIRGIDMIARIGGEEFLIAMPETAPVAAQAAAERLCRVIAQTPIALPGQAREIAVTISIGVALEGITGKPRTPVHQVIERADQALYGAKAEGRNQVTISRPAA